MFDYTISGGQFVDGTGTPARRADVGVVAGRIVAIGDLRERDARQTIDATSKVVCPDFIDIHQHSDFTPLVNRPCESAVRQGITSVVIGNCGHGCAPLYDPDCRSSRTARVLGRYVRDEAFYTLEDAIRRMTSLPATAMSMRERGVLHENFAADIVVFDPQTVRDNTTDLQPAR